MADTANTRNSSITKADVKSIGVGLDDDEFAPEHDRAYVRMDDPQANTTIWKTAWKGCLKEHDFIPYFCPAGWRRFSIINKKTNPHLNDHFWQNSSTMYHGTGPNCIPDILRNGFVPAKCQHAGKAVYLTPSIRYAAHPRYARVVKRNGLYFQVILQCRVLNSKLTHWKQAVAAGGGHQVIEGTPLPTGETMGCTDDENIDNNRGNDSMEFLWNSDSRVTAADGLLVHGIMVRCLSIDPIGAPENSWWLAWAKTVANGDPEQFLRNGYVLTA